MSLRIIGVVLVVIGTIGVGLRLFAVTKETGHLPSPLLWAVITAGVLVLLAPARKAQ